MQGSKKEPDISIGKSTSDSGLTFQALWSTMESNRLDSEVSKNSSFNIGPPPANHFQSVKLLDFSLQDQDSSSTQSTGQSYSRAARVGENDFKTKQMEFTQSGHDISLGKPEGNENKFSSSLEAHNYILPPLQPNYSQSFPSVTFQDQRFSRIMPTYDPQGLVMGVTSARVPLPLDLPTNEPIYVNAKQYRGILRRRQHRAKLEAQNKLLKNRKPYLHESRHQHAVKRARGLGGRFLNKKELQESKPVSTTGKSLTFSGSYSLNLRPQERDTKSNVTTSSSEVTNVSTSDDIYHPSEFRFYDYTSRSNEFVQGGGGNFL